MAYVTGLLLIDAPASALNNSGSEEGARTDNTIGVKKIRTKSGDYPYVSAQAFRYWLRTVLERNGYGWKSAPMSRESKIAYTDGDPIEWWDDDLFGYMRAESKKAGAKTDQTQSLSPTASDITRVSPLRVGTLVSLGPASIVDDFGTMARHKGDPVPHEHQFYRTTLQGLFSLNLSTAGTFFAGGQVGYRNLDENRVKKAKDKQLEELLLYGQQAFRLSISERTKRVSALIQAFGEIEGGAKQTLHYTDVTPPLVICAITAGGNHPFCRLFRSNSKGRAEVVVESLTEVLAIYKDQLLSDVFVGWARGYMDEERAAVEALSSEDRSGVNLRWGHPRAIMKQFAAELENSDNSDWYS